MALFWSSHSVLESLEGSVPGPVLLSCSLCLSRAFACQLCVGGSRAHLTSFWSSSLYPDMPTYISIEYLIGSSDLLHVLTRSTDLLPRICSISIPHVSICTLFYCPNQKLKHSFLTVPSLLLQMANLAPNPFGFLGKISPFCASFHHHLSDRRLFHL